MNGSHGNKRGRVTPRLAGSNEEIISLVLRIYQAIKYLSITRRDARLNSVFHLANGRLPHLPLQMLLSYVMYVIQTSCFCYNTSHL
jgi:hypothetical protein